MTGAADPADLTEEAVSKWGVKDVETWFYQVGLRGVSREVELEGGWRVIFWCEVIIVQAYLIII